MERIFMESAANAGDGQMPQRILVAMDPSDTAQHALQAAIRFALADDVMRVVHVIDEPLGSYSATQAPWADWQAARERWICEGQKLLSDAYTALQDAGIQADTRSIELRAWGGTVAGAVLREAQRWRADLLVLGTHGRRGARRLLLGSVAEEVLRKSRRPVMLIPEEPGKLIAAMAAAGTLVAR
ncbi:universal stress protein [Pandoraea vervacti]|nr:universal stress protein [Pandoraea vervacti]